MDIRNRVIEYRLCKASELVENPKNWRGHNKQQRAAYRALVSEIGFAGAVLARVLPDGRLMLNDGHMRKEEHPDAELPVLVTDLDEDEGDALLALYDPLGAMAETKTEKLKALLEMTRARHEGLTEALLAVAEANRVELATGEPTPDPGAQIDKAEELQQKWQVQRGDLWEIGDHRLLCGDSTKAEDVARLGKTDVLFSDPPYGINRDPSWLDDVGTHRQALSSRDVLAGDDGALALDFLFEYERRMIWGFPYIFDEQATGWIVWDKQPGVDGRGIVTPIEMASTTMRTGFDMVRCMWVGYYRASGETSQPHPTQKPVQVIAPFIEQWTKSDDIIFDPFIGSGTTLVACEQTGRRGRGIEIEPKYCAVTLERLSQMGLEARRVAESQRE